MYLTSEVPLALINILWPIVSEMFRPSIELSDGECNLDSAHNRLMTGENKLIVITRGRNIIMAYTVEVLTYETGLRELSVLLIGGRELDNMRTSFMPPIEEFAKLHKCTAIVMQGARAGWTRKLRPYGWKAGRQILKYKIGKQNA